MKGFISQVVRILEILQSQAIGYLLQVILTKSKVKLVIISDSDKQGVIV